MYSNTCTAPGLLLHANTWTDRHICIIVWFLLPQTYQLSWPFVPNSTCNSTCDRCLCVHVICTWLGPGYLRVSVADSLRQWGYLHLHPLSVLNHWVDYSDTGNGGLAQKKTKQTKTKMWPTGGACELLTWKRQETWLQQQPGMGIKNGKVSWKVGAFCGLQWGSRGQCPRWGSGGEAAWSFLRKIRRKNCIKQPCIFQFCQFLTWCKTITL